MEKIGISVIFIIWMFITLFFVISVIGIFMVYKVNTTGYHKYGIEMRTNWMQLGFDIKEKLLK